MHRLWTPRLVYAALALLLFAQRPAALAAGGAEIVRQRFLGAWRLVAFENISKEGKVTYPDFGPHAVGYLLYTPEGRMCGALMNPDRPQWNEPRTPTDQEKVRLFNSFYAYCGKYEIKEVEHVMMHLPEVALTPDFVGSLQPRPYTFEGNHLTFSGPDSGPQGGTYKVVWEKVE